jgi:hypothetical protein
MFTGWFVGWPTWAYILVAGVGSLGCVLNIWEMYRLGMFRKG